ncbi:unannotated protein [freshwater metagenome]|uniref:Unannotated protein n=1 Tax=freshwater metagenome TaxID=449393 RepID=A0A6J7EWZ1_9ZZZZ
MIDMTGHYTGITWDNPRGKNALFASIPEAREGLGLDISWSAHSLEHFEAHPIEDLAERFDLVIMDHPHVGDMCASGGFRPIEDVIGVERVQALSDSFVGPSFRSYQMEGKLWALPVDAATQVMASRADLIDSVPKTWEDILRLGREQTVCLSVAGPHAFLTFLSLCASFDAAVDDGLWREFPHSSIAIAVLEIMRELVTRQAPRTLKMNPIALLAAMIARNDIACVPLIYGYSQFARMTPRAVQFSDAPSGISSIRGSTIGGAGLAVTNRRSISPELVAYVAWLVSADTQTNFIPSHDGQPALASAWRDPNLNRQSAGFYANTLTTIQGAQVRPRFAGYAVYQEYASARIREGLVSGEATTDILKDIRVSFSQGLAHAGGKI